ncbi:MAG: hypothetical protein HY096_08280 [Nitrospinae bacterium]|nr:hypothetical protein [Nitrospinota bacterium]
MTRSGYIQGYNGQAVVTEGQIIVAAELEKNLKEIEGEENVDDLPDKNLWSEVLYNCMKCNPKTFFKHLQYQILIFESHALWGVLL